MINVSKEFKAELKADNRKFLSSCKITLASGKVLYIDNTQLWSNGFVINEATSNTGTFDIGSAIVSKLTLRLNNIYDTFTDYDFTDAVISSVKVSLVLQTGKTESILKGVYTVDETNYDGDIITLECLDNMHKFDVSYAKSSLGYPATLLEIVKDACKCCNMILSTDSLQFENYDYSISVKPENSDTVLFRDVLTWVGQISGHFWKCNSAGQLSAGWYNMSDLSADKNIHILNTDVVTDISADVDDVVITCIKVVTEDENSKQITYQSGADGYACVISDNKLITKDNAKKIAEMIAERVVGLRFRPLSISALPDPTIEAGDGAVVYDRKSKKYKTFFVNVTFSSDNDIQISNDAESALRNSAENFSQATRIYQALRKKLNDEKTEWEKAVEQLHEAMESKNGLFPVNEKQADGSTTLYFCDKPTLEESSTVIKLSAAGWGMSTDGGRTWNAGTLVDGTTITKLLKVIGINAEWVDTGTMSANRVRGGTLEVGGTGAGKDGAIILRNSSGVQIGKFDKNGLTATAGKFSGDITGATGIFSGAIKNDNGSFYSELSNGVLKGGQKSGAITGYISFDNYKTSSGVYGLRLAGKGCAVILTPSFGIANYVSSGSVTYSEGQSGSLTVVTGISASWTRLNLSGTYDVQNLCQNLSLNWNTKTITFTKGLMTTKL